MLLNRNHKTKISSVTYIRARREWRWQPPVGSLPRSPAPWGSYRRPGPAPRASPPSCSPSQAPSETSTEHSMTSVTCLLMAYSHWMSLRSGHGRMGCMVLCRTFYTAPEQGQGPEQGHGRMGYIPIFQVLKLFQVVCFSCFSGFQMSTPGFCSAGHNQCDYTMR